MTLLMADSVVIAARAVLLELWAETSANQSTAFGDGFQVQDPRLTDSPRGGIFTYPAEVEDIQEFPAITIDVLNEQVRQIEADKLHSQAGLVVSCWAESRRGVPESVHRQARRMAAIAVSILSYQRKTLRASDQPEGAVTDTRWQSTNYQRLPSLVRATLRFIVDLHEDP